MNNLKQLQTKYEELGKEIEQLKSLGKQIDFSEFIGRDGQNLAIRGEKYLKSSNNLSISYNDLNIEIFNNFISYTETTLDKLEYGDVFCINREGEYKLEDFKIFIGKDDSGDYAYQYLYNSYGVEKINYGFIKGGETIYKFNRS